MDTMLLSYTALYVVMVVAAGNGLDTMLLSNTTQPPPGL